MLTLFASIMQYFSFIPVAVLCSVTLHGQNNNESIVYLNGGGHIGSHNNIGTYMGMEYDRQLKGM